MILSRAIYGELASILKKRQRGAGQIPSGHHDYWQSAIATKIAHEVDPENTSGLLCLAAGAYYPYPKSKPEDVWASRTIRSRKLFSSLMSSLGEN